MKKIKQYSRYFILAGGIVIFLCFFIPWVEIDMSAVGDTSIIKMVGFRSATNQLNVTTLALISSLSIFCLSIYGLLNKRQSGIVRMIIIIGCITGTLSVLITFYEFFSNYKTYISITTGTNMAKNPQAEMNLENVFNIQFGGYGVIIGFVFAFIGAWYTPIQSPFIEVNK